MNSEYGQLATYHNKLLLRMAAAQLAVNKAKRGPRDEWYDIKLQTAMDTLTNLKIEFNQVKQEMETFQQR